jgi:hypothetical protein
MIGLYTWRIEENRLIIEVVEDECGIRLRAKNLIKQPWFYCNQPDSETPVFGK